MMKAIGIAILTCATATAWAAELGAAHRPYSSQQDRAIKSLSEGEVKQLQAGAGMGYAKAAELNHYPGPMHVLELADRLNLNEDQRAATRSLMDGHKIIARTLGGKRVEAERRLDELFWSGKLDRATLEKAVKASAALEGEYRLAHLETHLRMRELMSDEQVAKYDHLRGYVGGESVSGHGQHKTP